MGGMTRKTRTPRTSPALAACALRVRAGERMVRIMPAGEFHAPRGALAGAGPWRLTPDAAERIIAANRARTADILIDFEHQALLAEQNGRPVPAAGWIDPQSLEYRDTGDEPGLYGAVQWVGDTAALIEADQYRYLSPVFPYDADGTPLDLLHVALTNFPAIDEPLYAALSARTAARYRPDAPTHPEDSPMTLLQQLLAALGLPESTSENDALAGVAALKARADTADTQIAALKAAAPATPDPAKYVPIEAMQGMQAQLAALSARVNDDEAGRLIEQAMADGRLQEPLREWAQDLGRRDIAALRAYVDKAAPIAALKGMQTGGQAPAGAGGAGSPNDAQLAVCRALGLTAEEFGKAKLEDR